MNGKIRFWLPSIADIIFLCPFLLLSLVSGNNLLNDADTGHHIRTGEYIIKNLTVPKYDIFSHIEPPLPWVAHEWLSEVVMALVHQFSGLTGVVVFFSFWIGAVYFLLFRFARSLRFDLLPAVAIVMLATASSQLHWLARPHIFSLVLTVVWYGLLNNYQYQDKDRLYVLPLLMLLWVNLHGAFIIGFALLGVYFIGNLAALISQDEAGRNTAGEKCKKLALVTVVSLLFSLVNPRGYSILLFPFTTLSNRFLLDNIIEYLPPNFHDPLPYKYLLLLTLGVVTASRKRLDAVEFILLLLFTYMSLYATRNIPLFAIIVTPIVLRHFQAMLYKSESKSAKMFREQSKNLEFTDAVAKGHLWPIFAIAGVCALGASGAITFTFDPAKKPVAAVEFLKREKLMGRMFSDDEFGDYVIYAAWPEYRVAFDGRFDMYGEIWVKQYLAVLRLQPGWENVIEKNNFAWIFCGAETPLSVVLMENQNWHVVYTDKVAQIFVKNIPMNRLLIDKYLNAKTQS
jgi:hypothetical protein